MKRFTQTLKVMLALFVAVFSNGLLPSTAAYASQGGGNYQPVWCKLTGSGWQAQLASNGNGKDGPLTIPVDGYFMIHGQIFAHDRSDKLDAACAEQYTPHPTMVSPVAPTVVDVCGKENDSVTLPSTDGITYTKMQNGLTVTVTATPQKGYALNEVNGYTLKQDGTATYVVVLTDVPCIVVIPVPETPKVYDPCGPHNAHWIVPEDTNMIDWSFDHGHLIATAKKGYIFEGQKTYIDFGEAKDSNVPCIVEIPKPETPKVYDPCGTHNARWIVPKDTMQVDWSLNNKGELIATAKQGYIFEGQQQSINFGKAEDSGELCPVTPKAPKFIDYCGEQTDYVYIPDVKGVVYKINGHVVHEGYHKVTGTVTVEAYAEHDYVLVGEEVGPWTHTYVDMECVSISKTSLPVTDTNKDGYIGVGDVVTWEITVTNNSSNKLDNFKIQIEDSTATLANDGLIKHLEPGESVTITATSTLTATDMQACKATNTVTFMAWFNRHDARDKHDDKFDKNMLSLNMEHEDEYDLSGSATAEATFTCPTPGSGNGGSSTTTSTGLPAELPSTGPTDSANPLLVIAAAAVAYGATYFIQRRRELASN